MQSRMNALDDPGRAIPSPAEAAVAASELAVGSAELPRLLRLVARRLPADREAVAAALCEVRRKSWTGRLVDLSQRDGAIWVRREDAAAAAAAIADPDADELALRQALGVVMGARLRGLAADPARALELALAELFDAGGRVLSQAQHATLARLVADAFGAPADAPFVVAAVAAEDVRRGERRAAEAAARSGRRVEVQRLRDWERSLVEFRAVPALLGCSPKEALRWVAANRLPVARRIPLAGRDRGRGDQGGERWEFDPAELARLRPQVIGWREAEGGGDAPRIIVPSGGRAGNAAIARVAALDRYAAHFATARALQRRITLITGPTNSGKSHTALDRLSGAESGLALAPLRLLAHEFREALGARGVPASLATGEERIVEPGSRHLAATVEMCPLHNPVDVAIVDEAQMLHDADRGAAWTAAIMGAPAREVFVLGSPECAPMVRRIATLCADPIEEVTLVRKGPLDRRLRGGPPVRPGAPRRADRLLAPRRAGPARDAAGAGPPRRRGVRRAQPRGAPRRGEALQRGRRRDPDRHRRHRHGPQPRHPPCGVLGAAQVRRHPEP